jgi:hypothetical protein
LVRTPHRDRKQEPGAPDALGRLADPAPDELPVPVEDEPSTAAANRRKLVPVVLRIAAVAVAVGVTVYALNQPQPSVTARASSTTAKSTTAAPTTTTPAPTTTTDDQSPDEDTDDPTPSPSYDQLVATITAYYGFLPDNPDAAWALLTTDAKATYATFGDALTRYRQGWDQYSTVQVSDVFPSYPADTARVRVLVQYKDGRPESAIPYLVTVAEEDGQWKISDWLMIGG